MNIGSGEREKRSVEREKRTEKWEESSIVRVWRRQCSRGYDQSVWQSNQVWLSLWILRVQTISHVSNSSVATLRQWYSRFSKVITKSLDPYYAILPARARYSATYISMVCVTLGGVTWGLRVFPTLCCRWERDKQWVRGLYNVTRFWNSNSTFPSSHIPQTSSYSLCSCCRHHTPFLEFFQDITQYATVFLVDEPSFPSYRLLHLLQLVMTRGCVE